MKDENEFNAYLRKEFRRIRNSTHLGVMKMSERFQAGASDFLLVKNGKTILLECKFIKDLPARPDTQILSHPFTGPQIKFMDDLAMGGAECWGLVGIKSLGMMAAIPLHCLQIGNWSRREFGVLVFEHARLMDWKEVSFLVCILAGDPVPFEDEIHTHMDTPLRIISGAR